MASQERARVTVVVADDHPLYRDGVVRALLASGQVEIVAEAQTSTSSPERSCSPPSRSTRSRVGG